jgi:hypothetical protein
MRQQTARRIAALEEKLVGPGKYHVLTCMPDDSQEAAIDLYGRDRIAPNDHIIFVPAPFTALDL